MLFRSSPKETSNRRHDHIILHRLLLGKNWSTECLTEKPDSIYCPQERQKSESKKEIFSAHLNLVLIWHFRAAQIHFETGNVPTLMDFKGFVCFVFDGIPDYRLNVSSQQLFGFSCPAATSLWVWQESVPKIRSNIKLWRSKTVQIADLRWNDEQWATTVHF